VAVGASPHADGWQTPGRSAAARQWVAVVGPPAVGKTTTTVWVADALGADVFRLREFADQFRIGHPELDHLFATTDPLGWLPDATVQLLFGQGLAQRATAPVVLLENLPGNAAQLGYLAEIAATLDGVLRVVELAAPDSLLTVRARTRRVCLTCEPDRRGDAHRPAQAVAGMPDRCAACGGRLVPRRSDTPQLCRARLRRFRDNRPGIHAAAIRLRVPYTVVDATAFPNDIAQAFLAALPTPPATASHHHPRLRSV
jgi:adenylate kinase family enzyme